MLAKQDVLLAKDVKKLEQTWAETHGVSNWPLMQKAAQSFVCQFLDKFRNRKVIVIAGAGNNGGDGYYIAKLLLESGISASVCAPLGEPSSKLDAFRAKQEYEANGGLIVNDFSPLADIAIDALFGIGLNRELSEEAVALIQTINTHFPEVYSVDVPSGLNADTGMPCPVAIQAEATHCFIAYKPGLLTAEGPSLAGKLSLDNLGVVTTSEWCRSTELPALPSRCGNTHKAKHGNLRVIGSEKSMVGASVIAAKAALNAGAGRVFLHGNPQLLVSLFAETPEIMVSDQFEATDVRSVFVIGPGLGRDDRADALMQMMLNTTGRRGVLDADGLRYLAKNPTLDVSEWVLTPHENEAADLLGLSSHEVQANRPAAALQLTQKFNCVVVLKGAGSLVAQDNQLWFCHPGHPAMATPGMGDCLAGMIGSLIAQGLEPRQAALTGVNWHAALGKRLAKKQRIVLASDIIDQLKLSPE